MSFLRGRMFTSDPLQSLSAMIFGLVLATIALPLAAQSIVTSPIDGSTAIIPDAAANDVRAGLGSGAELRGLDKISGDVSTIMLSLGESATVGKIEVTLAECRYPEDNRAGEAYAWLTVRDPRTDKLLFDGWMIASSPALNALDHARYDIWVIRCTIA